MAIENTPGETISALSQALGSLWNSFITVFPGLIAAIIVIIIGWIVGRIIGEVVTRILKKLKVDYWIEKEGLKNALWGKSFSNVIGSLTKWYIVVVFLSAVTDLIKLPALTRFITQLVVYLPALFGAIVLVVLGILVAEYFKKSVLTTEVPYKSFVGSAVKFLIVYIALIVAMETAGFKVTILIDAFRIGFAALAITIAIIVGIGFGYAFRKDAENILKKLKKK